MITYPPLTSPPPPPENVTVKRTAKDIAIAVLFWAMLSGFSLWIVWLALCYVEAVTMLEGSAVWS
jgi:hypothetical protein